MKGKLIEAIPDIYSSLNQLPDRQWYTLKIKGRFLGLIHTVRMEILYSVNPKSLIGKRVDTGDKP